MYRWNYILTIPTKNYYRFPTKLKDTRSSKTDRHSGRSSGLSIQFQVFGTKNHGI